MVNWTLSLGAAFALLSLTAEAKDYSRHHHLKRATTTATTPPYKLFYSNLRRVPDFDDCIDYTVLSGSSYSKVAAKCAKTADVPNTGADFFAVYQTKDQKGSKFWWFGWWESALESTVEDWKSVV